MQQYRSTSVATVRDLRPIWLPSGHGIHFWRHPGVIASAAIRRFL